MAQLTQDKCVPCGSGAAKASPAEVASLMKHVPNWHLVTRESVDSLERVFRFPNFVDALAFTNRVGAIAEEQGHHPSLLTEWGRVTVAWWTHAVGGLHRNDFVMAAKTDELYQP